MGTIIALQKPDLSRHQEPGYALPRRTDYTVEIVKSAYLKSDVGEWAIACGVAGALLSDSRILGVCGTRAMGVFGAPVLFEESHEAPGSADIIYTLKDQNELWKIADEATLRRIFIDGILLNLGFGELVWTLWDGKWRMRLIWRDPQYLRYDREEKKWYLQVGNLGQEIEIRFGEGKWVAFRPFGDGSEGLWYPLSLLWIAKSFAQFDWGRRNEAIGRTALIGSSPKNATKEQEQAFARDLQNLKDRIGMVIPNGWTLAALDFGPGNHETFQRRIEMINTDYSILVLGQNLTTEVKGASLAAEKGHEIVRTDVKSQDETGWSTFFRDQVLRVFSAVRFGSPEAAPWVRYQVQPKPTPAELATTWKTAGEALEKLAPLGIDTKAFAAAFGIPLSADAATVPRP